jgi:hypothetical protein
MTIGPFHVHDPGLRRGLLGNFVGVVPGGQPGADVQELPDASLGNQVVHCPAEEGPLGADAEQHIRERGDDPLGGRRKLWTDRSYAITTRT